MVLGRYLLFEYSDVKDQELPRLMNYLKEGRGGTSKPRAPFVVWR